MKDLVGKRHDGRRRSGFFLLIITYGSTC